MNSHVEFAIVERVPLYHCLNHRLVTRLHHGFKLILNPLFVHRISSKEVDYLHFTFHIDKFIDFTLIMFNDFNYSVMSRSRANSFWKNETFYSKTYLSVFPPSIFPFTFCRYRLRSARILFQYPCSHQ